MVPAYSPLLLGSLVVGHPLAAEDVGELLNVRARDHRFTLLAPLPEPVDELRAQDVDLAVEDAAPVRDLLLLLGEILDQVLQLLIGERSQIRKSVHVRPS